MGIPRKPERKKEQPVDTFIKGGPAQNTISSNGEKKGRRVISLSLMIADAEWIDKTLFELNSYSERKITRSEIVSAAITVLKEKNIKDIAQLVKNR